MPQGTVAIEKGLTPVKELLEQSGYRVIGIEDADINAVDAIVVRGSDENITGRQDMMSRAPVIEATGRTPEEVRAEINRRVVD